MSEEAGHTVDRTCDDTSLIDRAAHDLHTPARRIRMLCEFIVSSGELSSERTRDCALRAIHGANEMSGLVDALLDYARSALRQKSSPRGPTALGPLIDAALLPLAAMIRGREATVIVNVCDAVWVDPASFEHALRPVVENGLLYAAADAPPSVEITCSQRRGWLDVRVKDHGIGISGQHHERVFRPLERLHSDLEYPGFGLGLASARNWMARSGGRLEIECSSEGAGSTFLLSFCTRDGPR